MTRSRAAVRVVNHSVSLGRWIGPALALVLVAAAAAAHGDVLETRAGVKYKGKLIERTADRVVFRLGEGNLTVRRVFKPSDVLRIHTDDDQPEANAADDGAPPVPASPRVRPEGKIYFVIPLEGDVGIFMTRELVAAALAHADSLDPDVVVFRINSPGGFIAEMLPIMDAIITWQRENPERRAVALVEEQALSAAAITAMGVREIYMTPGSSIGAAMVITAGADGKVDRVNEKLESALRAKARAAAEFGGHNPLLVEAMMAPDVELSLGRTAGGEPVVLPGPPERHQGAPAYRDVAALDAASTLLTLTPDEALRCGLIAGVVSGEAELMTKLGLDGAQPFDAFAIDAQAAHEDRIRRITREFDRLSKLLRKRRDARVLGGTYAAMIAQRNELRGIRASIGSIQRQAQKHAFVSQYIEASYGASFEGILGSVEEQLAWVEQQIARGQRAKGR